MDALVKIPNPGKYSLWIFGILSLTLTSCTTAKPPIEPPPGYYKEYDQKVNELRDAVDRGELTVAEAEDMRQKAFRDYVKEVEEKQVRMEYRNY